MNKLIRSFGFAFKGLGYAFKTQQNFRIHCFAAILACAFGYFLHITTDEWQWVMLCIMLMMVAELLNTAIEALVDLVSPDYNELAGRVKDVGAAAALVVAIFSLATGIIIFVPKLLLLVNAA
ncbi:diacylglycerol kinase family protein [Mucilaginibacter glaciei]|uniref:Diacylglycerol kinase family protein n=1 Tax=Mucilaginibacter glaciei TaxID=2772109 RepID=A0A926S2R9_9SPHI|nr:diacylglycerol kinase family protein [Mucilaginibacter glaciei]MBD1394152.1 diacylglycerol kinase family protein [Mucilaginibacter glaciei]